MLPQMIAAALVLCMTCMASQQDGAKNPLTVCELIQSGRKLDRQIVAVKGRLQDATGATDKPDFDELVATDCKLPDASVPKIRIVSPDSHFLAQPPPGYKPDLASVERVERQISEARARGKRIKYLSAVLEGAMIWADGRAIAEPDAAPRHQRYRAYLVVQRMRDVQIHFE
jgi:hypothetical protein